MLEMSRSVRDTLVSGRGGEWGGICMPRIDSDIQLVGTDIRNHAGKGNRCKLANRRESDTLLSAVGRRRENVCSGHSQERHRRGLGAYRVGGWGGVLLAMPAPQSVRVHEHIHTRKNTREGHASVCFQPRESKESRTDPELHDSAGAYPV